MDRRPPQPGQCYPGGVILLLLACRGPGPDPVLDDSPEDSRPDSTWTWSGELHELALVEGTPFALPMRLVLDPERRRGFVLSLSHSAVAEWDLDSHELVAVHPLDGRTSTGKSTPAVDQHGRVWVAGSGTKTIQVRAPEGSFGAVATDLISGLGAWSHPLGGVVVSGFDGEGQAQLVRYDEDLQPSEAVLADDYVIDLVPFGDGLLTLESTTGGVRLVQRGLDLASAASCSVPVEAHEVLPLSGDLILLTGGEASWTSACLSGGEALVSTQEVGTDDSQAFLLDDGLLILDRVGEEALDGRAWAVARWMDEELSVTDTRVTGKHSGYGQVDPATGLLWMNSEGTTEVLAMDPASGDIEARVQLGTHVEHALPDPDRPGRAWLTGRLSNTVGLLDLRQPELVTSHQDLTWPGAPVLDEADRLWMLELLSSTLVELDPSSLEVLQRHETGLGENATLTFDDLLRHPDRGSFFVSNGGTGGVAELSPEGLVLGSWAFPELAATDPQAVGELELHLAADGAVLLIQTDKLVLGRLDPDGGSRLRPLVGDEVVLLESGIARGLATSEGLLYVGRLAFDQDLERRSAKDLEGWYAVAETDQGLLVRQAEGVRRGDTTWSFTSTIGEPHLQLAEPWGELLVVPDYGGATVRVAEPGDAI